MTFDQIRAHCKTQAPSPKLVIAMLDALDSATLMWAELQSNEPDKAFQESINYGKLFQKLLDNKYDP